MRLKLVKSRLDLTRPDLAVTVGIVSVVAIGMLDFLTGIQIRLSFFYLLPVCFVTWLVGRRFGIMLTVLSAFVWFVAEEANLGSFYSHPYVPYVNTAVRLLFFLIIITTLTNLKKSLEHERTLARKDFSTGIG